MPFERLPSTVNTCCFCVKDLKAAVAIIAVLGIVTSPAVSWATVRHSYVIRMSCMVTTSENRPDVMDINFNNVLSFGFGANAGLSPSCLKGSASKSDVESGDTIASTSFRLKNDDKDKTKDKKDEPGQIQFSNNSAVIKFVKGFGWVLLILDLIFLLCSLVFLFKLFRGTELPFMKFYMWSLVFSAIFSFIYGLTYVIICVIKGGAFPIFEFVFVLVDLALHLIWFIIWIYFLFILRAYYHRRIIATENGNPYWSYYEYITKLFYDNLPHYFSGYYSYFWSLVYWILGRERQGRIQ